MKAQNNNDIENDIIDIINELINKNMIGCDKR